MRRHLDDWLDSSLPARPDQLGLIALRLHVTWDPDLARTSYERSLIDAAARKGDGAYLDLMELTLRLVADRELVLRAQALRQILSIGGSAYTVAPDNRTLTHRVEPTAYEAAVAAIGPDDEASKRLAAAWSAAFGRTPDAQHAWGEAIRAVEAALIPVIWPDPRTRGSQTLGSASAELRDHPERWRLGPTVGDPTLTPGTLHAMLSAMKYEPQRHGGDGREPATTEQAGAIVHLAVTVVSWCRAGLLARIS